MRDCLRGHHVDRLRGVDHAETPRLCFRARKEGGAHALEEIVALAFDAIGNQVAAAGALATVRHADIEQQGHRRGDADHAAFQLGNECRIEPASTALVGIAGIGKAVADHPSTALQCWQDHLTNMLRTRGEHQQQFGFDGGWFVVGVEQQVANLLGQRRAAGLAGGYDFEASCPQHLLQRR